MIEEARTAGIIGGPFVYRSLGPSSLCPDDFLNHVPSRSKRF